jgi:integrase
MRRGEVLGRTWGNTDLEGGYLHVCQQMTAHDGLRPTKTEKSTRKIAIDDITWAYLRRWKKEQMRQRETPPCLTLFHPLINEACAEAACSCIIPRFTPLSL